MGMRLISMEPIFVRILETLSPGGISGEHAVVCPLYEPMVSVRYESEYLNNFNKDPLMKEVFRYGCPKHLYSEWFQ